MCPISAEVGLTGRLKVGEWRVAPELNSLERDGHSVRVEPKIMQVLVTLAERPGSVLSKEHILRQVWPETFVSEEVLTRSISELRRVFQDNPREPTYIQTIPKGGYRLLAAVVAEGSDRQTISTRWWERRKGGLAIAAAVVLLGAFSFYFINRRQHAESRSRISSLAVLPLTNLSGDANQDYFTDGLTDELTTRLAKISALRVISRTSVMHYKGSTKTTPEIARELNVDALLVGSVLRSGDKVRISAQLIQARNDKNVWAESYERDLHDIIALQADVARKVAEQIKIQVTPQESEKVFTAGAVNPEAYDSYLKGNYYWGKFTVASMRKALFYYQQAIDKDPNYALAYVGLANAYHELWDAPPKEIVPKSRAASEKALQLDEGLAEAHSSLGWVKWIYYWDWAGAEAEFHRALQLNPNSSDAHGMYAEYLDSMGRFAEAAKEREIAKQISPVEPILYQNSGEHFLYGREFDKAIEQYNEALELDPTFAIAHFGLAQAYALKGMWKESMEHYEQSAILDGDPELASKVKAAYTKSGYQGATRVVLEDGRLKRSKGHWASFAGDAYWHITLGEKDLALAALDQAVRDREQGVTELQVDPSFDSIRSDPRFQQLMHQVGLSQ
jgi:TolB-like protein/DNA-binding winged helix-turn-helix (wHTH) protein/Tfp pilus assembly protein PilF